MAAFFFKILQGRDFSIFGLMKPLNWCSGQRAMYTVSGVPSVIVATQNIEQSHPWADFSVPGSTSTKHSCFFRFAGPPILVLLDLVIFGILVRLLRVSTLGRFFLGRIFVGLGEGYTLNRR